MKTERLPAGTLTVSAVEPAKRCEAFPLSLAELAAVLKYHRGHVKRQNLEVERLVRMVVKSGFKPGPKFMANITLAQEQAAAHQKRALQVATFIGKQWNTGHGMNGNKGNYGTNHPTLSDP